MKMNNEKILVSRQPIAKIVITPKGDYDSEVNYEPLDLVFHGGASYLAKMASQNKEPSADPASEGYVYWQLIAASGAGAPYVDNGILSWV